MKNIQYINDKDLVYNKDILQGLQSYNKSQTGYREKDYRDFYVFEEGVLVGACHSKQASDWCKINGIYYQNIDVLKALLNDVRKFYRGNVEGIHIEIVQEQRALDFQEIGFKVHGELNDMPSGNTNYFLLDKDLDPLDTDGDYQLNSSNEPLEPHDKVLKKEMKTYRKSLDFSTEKTNLQFAVLDKDKFVGGIYGHIQFEYLFINVLFVNKKYRGKRIASTLMDMIEEEAVKQGVTNIYLTTFEFQALNFYRKRGYEIVMTIEDFPKGFAEYTLYRNMK